MAARRPPGGRQATVSQGPTTAMPFASYRRGAKRPRRIGLNEQAEGAIQVALRSPEARLDTDDREAWSAEVPGLNATTAGKIGSVEGYFTALETVLFNMNIMGLVRPAPVAT